METPTDSQQKRCKLEWSSKIYLVLKENSSNQEFPTWQSDHSELEMEVKSFQITKN